MNAHVDVGLARGATPLKVRPAVHSASVTLGLAAKVASRLPPTIHTQMDTARLQ